MEPFLQFPKLVYSALTQDLAPALKNFCLLMITLFRRVFCPESDGSDARPAGSAAPRLQAGRPDDL
jgi:hypothetical protein